MAHHKAVLAHLLPALAAAVGRPGESRDTRFLCLKLLCDVILHFLLETDLYSSPGKQEQESGAGKLPFIASSCNLVSKHEQHKQPQTPL